MKKQLTTPKNSSQLNMGVAADATSLSPPLPVNADWREPTTYLRRFGDAMQLLCAGHRPSDALMLAWADADADDIRLQQFACKHGPSWAQGIGMIEAAQLMADLPTEGPKHERRTS